MMKTDCEYPYDTMITLAGAVHHVPVETTAWHVHQLATELAHAVIDLDARMRAGLNAPRAWRAHASAEVHHTHDKSDACASDDNHSEDHRNHGNGTKPDPPVFYSLPAADLETGMSTDDGKDIVAVTVSDDQVFADVCTPRSHGSEQGADRSVRATECRMYRRDELVGLATFVDTEIDGSDADTAQPHPHSPARTD